MIGYASVVTRSHDEPVAESIVGAMHISHSRPPAASETTAVSTSAPRVWPRRPHSCNRPIAKNG